MLSFEKQLSSAIRSLGRLIVEFILNQLEPDSHVSMPHDLDWQGSGYRRLRDKTANRYVATIFWNDLPLGSRLSLLASRSERSHNLSDRVTVVMDVSS